MCLSVLLCVETAGLVWSGLVWSERDWGVGATDHVGSLNYRTVARVSHADNTCRTEPTSRSLCVSLPHLISTLTLTFTFTRPPRQPFIQEHAIRIHPACGRTRRVIGAPASPIAQSDQARPVHTFTVRSPPRLFCLLPLLQGPRIPKGDANSRSNV